eukprot:SAG11_NODE_1008_length_6205_cov_3.939240_10_plen_104_part_00
MDYIIFKDNRVHCRPYGSHWIAPIVAIVGAVRRLRGQKFASPPEGTKAIRTGMSSLVVTKQSMSTSTTQRSQQDGSPSQIRRLQLPLRAVVFQKIKASATHIC